jgi:uncharacterized protein (DUF4415 family)
MGSRTLSPEQAAQIDALAAMPESAIDTSDIPEVTDWSGARRGIFTARAAGRDLPVALDAELVAWFKAEAGAGEPYEVKINQALRQFVESHARKAG